jgi:hypothetical protein
VVGDELTGEDELSEEGELRGMCSGFAPGVDALSSEWSFAIVVCFQGELDLLKCIRFNQISVQS